MVLSPQTGRQFESNVFAELTALLGCNRARTTAYHPAANDLVERFHRNLKAALKAHTQPDRWHETLPLVMLDIRTTVKEDLQYCTSSELVYGTTLKLPGQFVTPDTLTPLLDPSKCVHRLRHHMSQFNFVDTLDTGLKTYFCGV